MQQNIIFIPKTAEVASLIEPPQPAVQCLPNWYKKVSRFENSHKPHITVNGLKLVADSTIKGCMPVFDAITMGYIQKSWADIYVERKNGQVNIYGAGALEIVGKRYAINEKQVPSPPLGFDETVFHFRRPWTPKTPVGYSVLYTHPSYHTDLPFIILPGIVDSDVFQGAGEGSPAFFINKEFEGVIPKGTVLYQIFPFKRCEWVSTIAEAGQYDKILREVAIKNKTRIWDRYKKEFWKKKRY